MTLPFPISLPCGSFLLCPPPSLPLGWVAFSRLALLGINVLLLLFSGFLLGPVSVVALWAGVRCFRATVL